MADPSVADADGEWFEVFNATGSIVYLDGVEVYDNTGESFTITDVWLDVGTTNSYPGAVVLGNNGDSATNGGVEVGYVYTGFTLDNTTDAINIRAGATVIDTFEYDAAYAVTEGASIGLDLDQLSVKTAGASENDDSSIWCSSELELDGGDYGTPGTWNDSCTTSNVDVDGDGWYNNVDCDDNDANTYPGAAFEESAVVCMTDEDGDGYGSDLSLIHI